MQKINLKEAETRLAELIEEAASGEDIIIIRSDGSSFKILPMTVEELFPNFDRSKFLISAFYTLFFDSLFALIFIHHG